MNILVGFFEGRFGCLFLAKRGKFHRIDNIEGIVEHVGCMLGLYWGTFRGGV